MGVGAIRNKDYKLFSGVVDLINPVLSLFSNTVDTDASGYSFAIGFQVFA